MHARGLSFGWIAALLMALMAALLYQAHHYAEVFSPLASVTLRATINFFLVLLYCKFARPSSVPKLQAALKTRVLWIWGCLGAATITLFIFSIEAIGITRASVIHALTGIFVVLFSATLFQRAPRWRESVSIVGCFSGFLMLTGPEFTETTTIGHGELLTLGSAMTAGLAYATISASRATYPPEGFSLSWCICTILAMGVIHLVWAVPWPKLPVTYVFLVGSAILASLAQFSLTLAYQNAPAPEVATTAYLQPVFALFIELTLFGTSFGATDLAALSLILFFGAAIPLVEHILQKKHHTPLATRSSIIASFFKLRA